METQIHELMCTVIHEHVQQRKKNDIPVVGGCGVVDGFPVVDGTVGITSVGDGSSVVSEYSAWNPRSGSNEE